MNAKDARCLGPWYSVCLFNFTHFGLKYSDSSSIIHREREWPMWSLTADSSLLSHLFQNRINCPLDANLSLTILVSGLVFGWLVLEEMNPNLIFCFGEADTRCFLYNDWPSILTSRSCFVVETSKCYCKNPPKYNFILVISLGIMII